MILASPGSCNSASNSLRDIGLELSASTPPGIRATFWDPNPLDIKHSRIGFDDTTTRSARSINHFPWIGIVVEQSPSDGNVTTKCLTPPNFIAAQACAVSSGGQTCTMDGANRWIDRTNRHSATGSQLPRESIA